MMKIRRITAAVALCALSGLGAGSCNDNGPKPVELTLFHTNDIHSHERAAKSEPFGLGGMARLSTLLTQLRAKAPVSMTLDAGDYSEGTWYYTVDTGASTLKMLDAMKYDAVALGNHDYLMGLDQIIATMNAAKTSFPVLAANLDPNTYPRASELRAALPPTFVKTVGGIKVGIIGLTTFDFAYNSYVAPGVLQNPQDVATALANELRPQVDVLILLSHNSFGLNQQLAQNVPGIDAVISGHSHRKVSQVIFATNAGRQVPVVEAYEWAKFLGELKLKVTPRNGSAAPRVQFESYQLHPVSPDIPEDPAIARMIDEQDQKLDAKFGQDVVNRVIGQATDGLSRADGAETPLNNLAVRAYRASTHSDVAVELGSLTGTALGKGPITVMDAHDVAPHIYDPKTDSEWRLRVWNIKGDELSMLFDILYTINGIMPLDSPTGWLVADGATVTWNSSRAPVSIDEVRAHGLSRIPKVDQVLVGGVPLDTSKRYTLTLSDGVLLSIRLANEIAHLNLDMSGIQDSGVETWKSVVDFVSKAGSIGPRDFAVGGHSMTEGPDLGIFDYAIDWDGTSLSVEVKNLGLKTSVVGTLKCSTGLPNDFVAFNTPLEKWTDLPPQTIVEPLAPGAVQTYHIPWDSQRLAKGYWPVQCGVASSGDAYAPDDTVVKVFRN
jgi:5'-nucleotidase